MWKRIAAGTATIVGVTALVKWWHHEKPLFISLDRVNREFKNRLMDDPEEHVYRERVKNRIMKGEACTHPPLFNDNKQARLKLVRRIDAEARTA